MKAFCMSSRNCEQAINMNEQMEDSMSSVFKNEKVRTRNAIYMRIPEDTMKEIERICKETGARPQQVLLSGFKNSNSAMLGSFGKSAAQILTALNRIGNNVNQIARRMNAGVSWGWSNEFEKFSVEIEQMRRMLGTALGNC